MNQCPLCLNEVEPGLERCRSCDEASAPTAAPPEIARHPGAEVDDHDRTSWSSVDGGRFVSGSVLADRYRIVGLLGRGGMGEVYRADDLKLEQTVALKFLPDEMAHNGAALARFHHEVRVARQVSHPNVCRVFDFGEADGHLFLTMEYIDGEDLMGLLRRIGRLPGDKALEIARQLCAGLAAAHDAGVLHRDLKPANVMIDGRGHARLTDFGLAGVAKELRREPLAGTPAYMSPEQRAGAELTPKSDLYALGLVLYELFTGRPAFPRDADRDTSSVEPPSAVVSGLDPTIDRVILRCLERVPGDRPSNAIQVAAALPGGDPLAAALAAGETPSPEMVAAAPARGTLSTAAALAALAGVVLLLVVLAVLNQSARLYRVVALVTPPDVLEDRARKVLEAAGWDGDGSDSARGFEPNSSLYERRGATPETAFWQRLAADPEAAVHFWYRRADRPLVPAGDLLVSRGSPPLETTGDALVELDTAGRLRRVVVVPQGGMTDDVDRIDWGPLLEASGFDPATLEPAEPTRTPPVFADELRAWLAPPAEGSDIGLRIEAAAHHGRVVSFDVVGPWTPSRLAPEEGLAKRTTAGLVLLLSVICVVVVAGIALARRNLRLGRGDRKGAARLGLFVLVVVSASGLLGAHHVVDLAGEYRLVLEIAAMATTAAALIWLLYIAIEPSLRRSAPQLLVAWSRLLSGEWRDPMVGRDVLLGGLLGLFHTLAISLSIHLPLWIGDRRYPPVPDLIWEGLANTRVLVANVAGNGLVRGLFFALLVMTAYLLLLGILRRPRTATAVLWLLIFLVPTLIFLRSWMMVPVAMLSATAMSLAAVRLGLLALTTYHVFFITSNFLPLAIDTRIWYTPQIMLAASFLIALAAVGARLAIGGQKLLPE